MKPEIQKRAAEIAASHKASKVFVNDKTEFFTDKGLALASVGGKADLLDTYEAPEAIKHIVTEDDLDNNPDLVDEGVKVGDQVEIPADAVVVEGEKPTSTKKATAKKAAAKK